VRLNRQSESMPKRSPEYIASQVAGSCRLEGIRVSASDMAIMTDVISGRADSVLLRQKIVERYQNKNRASLTVAFG